MFAVEGVVEVDESAGIPLDLQPFVESMTLARFSYIMIVVWT